MHCISVCVSLSECVCVCTCVDVYNQSIKVPHVIINPHSSYFLTMLFISEPEHVAGFTSRRTACYSTN